MRRTSELSGSPGPGNPPAHLRHDLGNGYASSMLRERSNPLKSKLPQRPLRDARSHRLLASVGQVGSPCRSPSHGTTPTTGPTAEWCCAGGPGRAIPLMSG
jgi:hypothetical protein